MSRQPHPNERWVVSGICLFLVAIVWAVFGQTVGFGFVNFDDPAYTTNNPMVEKGLSLEVPAMGIFVFRNWTLASVHVASPICSTGNSTARGRAGIT